jgi:tRNA/tmRNA/rRNA uracil-C5-methylase (TrmA/RlmC/RlmD family)
MDFVVDGMKVGLRKKGNFREIVDIPNCPIQSKSSNEILELFRSVLKRFSTIPVLRRENQGILKYITIRSAPEFEKRILILTFISKEECLLHPELNEFKKIISETFSECNILACFGPRESEVSGTGDEDEIWNGEPELKFQFLNQSFESHYSGFVQPNLFEFTKVVLKLKELVPNSMERLYDVYCGMGFFSQIFKDRWRYAVGLESHPGAIERAKANFDPKSSEWHSMDLSLKKTKIPFQEEGFLILDPPRSGLGKQVLDWILANPWKEGVYVSCNPKTQILDWKVLSEFYEVVSFHVFDPYPFTPHLETILQFRRKSAFADT